MATNDGDTATRLADARIAEWIFILTFVACAYFYAGAGWNQNSQFDLTRAIVEDHSFAIDGFRGNTGDVSYAGGHVYTNKSPGLSWMGAIPYAAIHALEARAGINAGDARVLALNSYLCTLLVVVPFCALGAALVYRAGRQRNTAVWAAAVALISVLATEQWPYSTFFILHVPSGVLMLYALGGRRPALSGFSGGLATATNYLCAPAILIFAVVRRSWREAAGFVAGAIPPLIALAVYQRVCFGAFARNSMTVTDARFVSRGAALGLFAAPSLDALYGITVSAYRGLFYFAPVLLMAVVGMVQWWREGDQRRELIAIVLVTVVFFAFNASFNGWEGGFGIGARYLVPLIPLWAVALLRARPRAAVVVLAILSFGINFAATAVDPEPSGTIPRPLTQYILPLLVQGRFSPDVPITPPWSAATFTGHTSVNRFAHDEPVVFRRHPPGSDVSEWSSFNLGESFFGAGDARSLIPIGLVLTAGIAAILARARRVPQS